MWEILKIIAPKAVDAAGAGLKAMRTAYTERQQRFVIDAIVPGYCLIMAEAVPGEVSLESIDGKIRVAQRENPEDAEKCGIPGIDDPRRSEKIEEILNDMVKAGKLRYHPPKRWSVC